MKSKDVRDIVLSKYENGDNPAKIFRDDTVSILAISSSNLIRFIWFFLKIRFEMLHKTHDFYFF